MWDWEAFYMRVPERLWGEFCTNLPAWYVEPAPGEYYILCIDDPQIPSFPEYPETFWNWALVVGERPELFINEAPYWPLPP